MISQSTIDEVRERASLSELVGESVALRRQGAAVVGLCPFHSEKSPSFFIRDDRTYRCFGCGASGNAITFIMETRGLSFPDAVEELARRLGIRIERTGKSHSDEPKEDRELLFRVNKIASTFFRSQLQRAAPVVASYVRERGLSEASCDAFGIGFAPREFHALRDHLREKGVTDEQAMTVGLVRRSAKGELYDTFRGRLIFPIFHDARRIAAFGGRLIPSLFNEEERAQSPKYVNSPESPLYKKNKTFYGLPQAWNAIRESGEVIIVEGYMDVVGLAQVGVAHCVATCGTALTENHVRRLAHIAPHVTILFDGDAAGKAAAGKCFPLFLNSGLDATALFLPGEEDPDDVARRLGENTPSYIKDLPRISLFECFLETEIDSITASSGGQLGAALKGKLAADIGSLISRVTNPVEKALLIEQLSSRLSLPDGSVAALTSSRPSRSASPQSESGELKGTPSRAEICSVDGLPRLDQEVLSCVIADRPLLNDALTDAPLCERLAPDTLRFMSELHKIMQSPQNEEGKKREVKDLLSLCGDSWLSLWKKAYRMREDSQVNIRVLFSDCQLTSRKNKVILELREIDQMLKGEVDSEVRDRLANARLDLSKKLHAM